MPLHNIIVLSISVEELGVIECQDTKENRTTNSSTSNEWSSSSIERGFLNMNRERKSTEVENGSPDFPFSDEETRAAPTSFAHGLMKSNSVVARASMWQQLQEKAKGDYSVFFIYFFTPLSLLQRS